VPTLECVERKDTTTRGPFEASSGRRWRGKRPGQQAARMLKGSRASKGRMAASFPRPSRQVEVRSGSSAALTAPKRDFCSTP